MQINYFFFLAEDGIMLVDSFSERHGKNMVCFERDLIAEKNRRAEIKSSVIKRWNVNYIDLETLKRQEEESKAMEIFNRLESEKAEDEAKKQAEINQAYLDAEEATRKWMDENYNESTGSFSGMYGQGDMDDVTKDQVDLILHEKDAAIQGMFAANAVKA